MVCAGAFRDRRGRRGHARVDRIYDNPKPIIDAATALLRDVPA